MRRTNTGKNQEPIRTPIVRLQDCKTYETCETPFSSGNRIKGNTQNIPQMSYSLNVKEEEEDEDLKVNEANSQFLSIPRVSVQTPPVQSLKARSQSVPSFENKILMDYCLVKSINNKANEDLITFSSRHLSFHSPSESSPSTTLYYKLYEGSNVVNPIEEGHHTERESPNSSTFIKNNDRLEKSKRIWSTLDDYHSKSYRKQIQNFQIKSYSQRPPTPIETKELQKASLKEINDDIEEIQIIEINKNLSFDKTAGSENILNKSSIYWKT